MSPYGELRGLRGGIEAYGGTSACSGVSEGLGIQMFDSGDGEDEGEGEGGSFWEGVAHAERRWAEGNSR